MPLEDHLIEGVACMCDARKNLDNGLVYDQLYAWLLDSLKILDDEEIDSTEERTLNQMVEVGQEVIAVSCQCRLIGALSYICTLASNCR